MGIARLGACVNYKLIATIDNDRREIEFDCLWDAHIGAYALLKARKGWPTQILFRGVEISGEKELTEFDHQMKIEMKKPNAKKLIKFRQRIIELARVRIMPQ